MQHIHRPGVLRDHFWQTAVGHRAFVQVGADQRHAAALQPPVHLLAGETPLGFLAPEQPAGAVDGRVERGPRLRTLDALDDHRIVAHRTADKATLTGERWRRALAHHPYIAPLVGLAPGVVMVVVHRVGHGAAAVSLNPCRLPFSARGGVTPRKVDRCDVPAAQFAVLVNPRVRDIDAAFAAGRFEVPGCARVPESAATEMNADPDKAILVAQEIDVVIAGPDGAELRRRLLAI